MLQRRCAGTEPSPAPAAALAALYESAGDLHVVLIRRSIALPTHPGEMALPGGRVDTGEGMVAAALREAQEEVGIEPASVEVVGWLDRVTGRTSGSVATPVVGLLDGEPTLVPAPAEVDAAFTASLRELTTVYRQEIWDVPVPDRPMHFFDLGHAVVWGMTARALYQLLTVLTEQTAPPGPARSRGRAGTTRP